MATKAPPLMNDPLNGNGVDLRRGSNPEHDDIVLNKATQLARKGERKEAIALFRQALRIRPEHAKAHHNLGVALSEEKEYGSPVHRCKTLAKLPKRHKSADSDQLPAGIFPFLGFRDEPLLSSPK
jgi:tetratricopeptide (TPR) repeat protein